MDEIMLSEEEKTLPEENEILFPPWYEPTAEEREALVEETLTGETLDAVIEAGFQRIKKSLPGYEMRKDQISMAKDILRSFYRGHNSVIEAGTGTGKSFAYLIAGTAISYLKAGRVVISTETRGLQMQLFEKDLEFIRKNVDSSLPYSLALGSSNYLCRLRYDEAMSRGAFLDVVDSSGMEEISRWAKNAFSGKNDGNYFFAPFPIPYSFWSSISRDSQGCPGRRCFHYSSCNYFRVKNSWAQSRIIVANHHLVLYNFINDKATLPPYTALVLDEGHGFLETAYRIFTLTQADASLEENSRLYEKNIQAAGHLPMGGEMAAEYSEKIVATRNSWKKIFQQWEIALDLSFSDEGTKSIEKNHLKLTPALKEDYEIVIENLREMEESINAKLEDIEDSATLNALMGFMKFCQNARELVEAFYELHLQKKARKNIYWGTKKKGVFHLNTVPLSVGEPIAGFLTEPVVFTSATLGFWSASGKPRNAEEMTQKGYFNPLVKDYGADLFHTKKIYLSDFPYQKNARIYIPADIFSPVFGAPQEEQRAYEKKLFDRILDLCELSRGGALVLFTSNYLLDKAHEYMEENSDLEIYHQRIHGVSEAISLFRDNPNSVLMGTISYWQGIDISGFALRHIIITKLYFNPPDDPIFAARAREMKEKGESDFFGLSLPWASMLLRQAAGRLIRSRTDKGVISILDDRLIKKNYGEILLNNLPPVKILKNLKDLEAEAKTALLFKEE